MSTETHTSTATLEPSPTVSPSLDQPGSTTLQNDLPRCQHRYPNGTQCRIPAKSSHSGLCSRHSKQSRASNLCLPPAPTDSEDLSAELLAELSEFDSGVPINQFLARLLVLVTKGRITPRRASVLAYITNQLLHSNRAIQKEESDEPQQIVFDLPRPKRDWPEGSERAYYERFSRHSAPNNTTPETADTKES